jgi:hypothetical protein
LAQDPGAGVELLIKKALQILWLPLLTN